MNAIDKFLSQAKTPEAQVTEPKDPVNPVNKWLSQSNKHMGGDNTLSSDTAVGESRFDKEFHSNLNTDLEDFRSREQWWIEKSAKGLGRVGTTVLAELSKLPGYLGGAAIAPFTDDPMKTFVDNQWIKAIEDAQEYVNNNALPVYTREAVRNGNLWDNISSVDFWATEGADGLGFMLSMMVPGVALGKLGTGTKIMSGLSRTKAGFNMASKMDDAARAMGIADAGGAIDLGLATVVNTLYESGAEANSIYNNMERKEGESEEAFNMRRSEAARNVFVSNLAILTVPNLLLNKSLMGALTPSSMTKNFKVAGNRIVSNVTEKTLKQKLKTYGTTIASNTLREGFFEEGMQSAVEDYFKDNRDFNVEDIIDTYLDGLGKVDNQKAIFLGALFGSVAGVRGDMRQNKVDTKQAGIIESLLNQGVDIFEKSQGGVYKKDADGNLAKDENGNPILDLGSLAGIAEAQANLQKRFEALQDAYSMGDVEMFNLLQNQLETELISSFMTAGKEGIDLLGEKLSASEEFNKSTEKLSDLGFDITSENRIASIKNRANKLLSTTEAYKNYVLPKVKGKGDILPEFKSKMFNIYTKTKGDLDYINTRIKELEAQKSREMNDLMETLDAQEEELTTNPIISNIDNSIKELKELKEDKKKEINDLINNKSLQEKYDKFEKAKDVIEEAVEKEKEVTEKEVQKEKEQVNESKVENEKIKQEQLEEEIEEGKQEVNRLYDLVDNIFNESKKKHEEGGFVTGTGVQQKGGEVEKFISGMYDENTNRVIFLSATPQELKDAFPELNSPEMMGGVTITPLKDDNGNDAYRITYTTIEGAKKLPLISKYEQKVEKDFKTLSNEDINNQDTPYFSEINNEEVDRYEKDQIKAHSGEETINLRQDVKLVESTDKMITSDNYKDFKESPRDKTGEQVGFMIGSAGTNKLAEKAIEMYNNRDFSDPQFLIDYLPIRVTFGEGIYTQLFFKNDIDDSTDLSPAEVQLRTEIVNSLIKGNEFKDISSKISFQYAGRVKNIKRDSTNSPAINSIGDLITVEDYDNIDFVYTNKEGQYMNLDKQQDSDLLGMFTNNRKLRGSIFIKEKGVNGKIIPLLLNIRRVNSQEADFLITVADKMLDPKYKIRFKDRISQHTDIMNYVDTQMQDQLTALGLSIDNATIEELFNNIVFDGNSIKNYFKFDKGTLIYGKNTVEHEEFQKSRDNIKNWLMNNKNRNIKVEKLKETEYRKYMIDSLTLSTDIVTGENIFQGNTSIYISPSIEASKQNPIEPSEDVVQPTERKRRIKKTKNKKTPLERFKNNIKDVNKDNNESNTIC